MIVVFKAANVNNIKTCDVDCCVEPRSADDTICTARYALYRLVWRGWMRLTAELSAHLRVSIATWGREFIYWSGRPVWRSEANGHASRQLEHPDGLLRRYDGGAWYWENRDGYMEMTGDGMVMWDSIASWKQ